jgi:TRAP-type mannitol/chloroaromatic compound transport system permease small subunit
MSERLANLVGRPVAWLFVAAALFSAYEVVMRYAFDAPSNWVHVTSTALCAVAFGFGGAWCMARDEHIRITVFADRLPAGARRALEALGLLLGLVYLGGLGWGVWLQAESSVLRFDGGVWQPELTPGPPNWPLPALIKGSLLMAVALFAGVVAGRLRHPSRER